MDYIYIYIYYFNRTLDELIEYNLLSKELEKFKYKFLKKKKALLINKRTILSYLLLLNIKEIYPYFNNEKFGPIIDLNNIIADNKTISEIIDDAYLNIFRLLAKSNYYFLETNDEKRFEVIMSDILYYEDKIFRLSYDYLYKWDRSHFK